VVLEARDVACRRGVRQLFAGVSFVVRPGDCWEVRGPNGSGKTSLLRILCGLRPPDAGEVRWNDEPIAARREEYMASMTYISHRAAIKAELTALENLRVATALSGWRVGDADTRRALDRMGLSGQRQLPGRRLSEGQQRRLALARLLLTPTPLWLLDEVLTALDAAAARNVAAMLDEHLAGGGMAVVATHQPLALGARVPRRIELAA